jgi:hypothetical protein
MVLRFLRNKVVEVEPQADGTVFVSWRLTDDLMRLEVELVVQPPELEIVEARARVSRLAPKACRAMAECIDRVEGVSIGGGLRKIVRGLLSAEGPGGLVADAVLESANAVILHFTRPRIQAGEGAKVSLEESLARSRAMVKLNPRLVRSCIAYQDDSPIMQGLKL